jgi:glucokinase
MTKRVKIGIDLGATRIKFGLIDNKGRVIHRREIGTPVNAKQPELINSIVNNVKEIIKDSGVKKSHILGVGIGVPGPVDSERGIVRYFPNIKGWEGVHLKPILQDKLDLKVQIDNDVNAMTLGEYKFGAGKGCLNLICLTLGTGVGGGIIINGEIYRGSTLCAGEIGHIPINEKGPRCNCRGIACLERYIGNRYILNRSKRIFGHNITLERLDRLARQGNRDALKIWEDVAKKLGTVLAGVVNLLNPDKIVIGGGVSKAGMLILKPLRREISRRAMKDQAYHVKIGRSRLGENAGIIGASLLV